MAGEPMHTGNTGNNDDMGNIGKILATCVILHGDIGNATNMSNLGYTGTNGNMIKILGWSCIVSLEP